MVKIIALDSVESKQIDAIGHCQDTNTLAIRFKNGKGEAGSTYHYSNFTAEDFEAFKGAESFGRYFGENIKKETEKYPFRKVPATEKVQGDEK